MTAASLVATRQASATARGQVQDLRFLESERVAVVVPGSRRCDVGGCARPAQRRGAAHRARARAPSRRARAAPRRPRHPQPAAGARRFTAQILLPYAYPSGRLDAPPRARFSTLPKHKTLTAHLDVPEMWLVTTAAAACDLDNLKLEDLPEGQSVIFARSIAIGRCSSRDTASRTARTRPPRARNSCSETPARSS